MFAVASKPNNLCVANVLTIGYSLRKQGNAQTMQGKAMLVREMAELFKPMSNILLFEWLGSRVEDHTMPTQKSDFLLLVFSVFR